MALKKNPFSWANLRSGKNIYKNFRFLAHTQLRFQEVISEIWGIDICLTSKNVNTPFKYHPNNFYYFIVLFPNLKDESLDFRRILENKLSAQVI